MFKLNARFVVGFTSLFLFISAVTAGGSADRFRSDHFEFMADRPLAQSLQDQLIEVAEATYELLNWWVEPGRTRNRIHLFGNESSYLREGGVRGSAGVHFSASNEVLMQLSLDQGTHLSDSTRRVLIHEVTHQTLNGLLADAPPWLVEGIAVYVESIPFRSGRFLEAHVYFRRAPLLKGCPGDQVETVPVATLFRSSRSDWNAQFHLNSHGANRQYQIAYLVTYYLMHFRAAPRPRPMRQFLLSLHELLESGQAADQAFRIGDYALSNSECEALEAAMIQAFSEVNLAIEPQDS